MNFLQNLIKSKKNLDDQPQQRNFLRTQQTTQSQKDLKRKLRIFQIKLLFAHRINQIYQKIKLYGPSNIDLDPKYRQKQQIIQKLSQINQTVSCLNEGSKKKKKARNRTIIYPDQTFYVLWSSINLLLLLYFLTVMPWLFAFNVNSGFINSVEKGIDIFFIIDVLLNFNLSYKLKNGKYSNCRKQITKKYLKQYFVIDLFTCIPFTLIYSGKQNDIGGLNKILRIVKLPKIIQTFKANQNFRLSTILTNLKLGNLWRYKIKTKKNLLNSIYFASLTFLVLHLGGCVFIFLGLSDSVYQTTWIISQNLLGKSKTEIYISAIYYCFVVLTTVGYGDITPQNTHERIFSIFWMLFGVVFYSFTISFISFSFTFKETKKQLLHNKLNDYTQFAKKNQIPENLSKQIFQNIEYSADRICYRWIQKENRILNNMPLNIKYEFFKQLFPQLYECPFFSTTRNQQFIVKIIGLLKPVQYKQQEYIWNKYDRPNFVIFIQKGTVLMRTENIFLESIDLQAKQEKIRALSNNQDFQRLKKLKIVKKLIQINNIAQKPRNSTQKFFAKKGNQYVNEILCLEQFVLKEFGVGSYLGDEEILSNSNRFFWLQAATDIDAFMLSKLDFENIVKNQFPHQYQNILSYGKEKFDNFIQSQEDLFNKIYQLATKQGYKISKGQKLIQNVTSKYRNKFTCKKLQKVKDFQSLRQIYQETTQLNPLQHNLKYLDVDIEVKEMSDLSSDEEINYQNTKTPGLLEMYKNLYSNIKRTKNVVVQLY